MEGEAMTDVKLIAEELERNNATLRNSYPYDHPLRIRARRALENFVALVGSDSPRVITLDLDALPEGELERIRQEVPRV